MFWHIIQIRVITSSIWAVVYLPVLTQLHDNPYWVFLNHSNQSHYVWMVQVLHDNWIQVKEYSYSLLYFIFVYFIVYFCYISNVYYRLSQNFLKIKIIKKLTDVLHKTSKFNMWKLFISIYCIIFMTFCYCVIYTTANNLKILPLSFSKVNSQRQQQCFSTFMTNCPQLYLIPWLFNSWLFVSVIYLM